MIYKIFISHASKDLPVAESIKSIITEVFNGKIELFMAASDLLSAAEWKAELKNQLAANDAIISLMTADSIGKPWLYVEWSPFWLSDKVVYVLHTGDVNLGELIHPMQDRQATNILNREQVRGLFASLAAKADSKIPADHIDRFVIAMKQAVEKKLLNTYDIYRHNKSVLPASDVMKKEIAMFFYDQQEIDVFISIAQEIRDDLLKADLIVDILRDNKLLGDEKLKIVKDISESINSADRLVLVLVQLIKHGDIDSPVTIEIVDNIAYRSRAELRKVAVILIEYNLEESDIFHYICKKISSNNVEFRKVLQELIACDKGQTKNFLNLMKLFSNVAEIKNLALFMIENQSQGSPQFEEVLRTVYGKNKEHFMTIMDILKIEDADFYDTIKDKYKL
jgi:hypothetical protein